MKRIQFNCRLLSDVILSTTAAMEGEKETLDFIPGGSFLGIAASRLYYDGKNDGRLGEEESLLAFHSGKVRFGDAHLTASGMRSEKIPAMFFHPKLKKETEECIVHHKWKEDSEVQLKQCRNGFYIFDGKEHIGRKVKAQTNVAIKSAYDRENRRSKDQAMYSYESLCKEQVFAFEVELDDDVYSLEDKICAALCGIRHLGKSKTAQYGLVEISRTAFTQVSSGKAEDDTATVYADGRLIFLDDNGLPFFQPTARQLGFADNAEVDWTRSQIRTFQYAPWNAKRHNADTDRCGLEKGSVLIVKLNGSQSPETSRYVGAYQNEGFGSVVYNPEFLNATEEGKALYTLGELKESPGHDKALGKTDLGLIQSTYNSALFKRLESIRITNDPYSVVNDFIKKNYAIFCDKDERFASQWGHIRELAERASDSNIFEKMVEEYLDHGGAAEKWRYKKNTLMDFIKTNKDKPEWKEVMINLSAEMAKKCKR